MTNADKYLKDGVDIHKLADEMNKYYDITTSDIYEAVSMFFQDTAIPTLTEDEKVILRNIPKEYIKIRREKYTKNIYVEKEKVEKEEDWEILPVYNHLFQFIKERRRILY